jgi:hypothetical protein
MIPDYFFCPVPTCPAHDLDPSLTDWYVRFGFHMTKAFGRVQRYKCRSCGKTFSDQTFLLNYWLKKSTDFLELGRDINSSASSNFIARHHHFSADSMRIRHDRLARNALFLQSVLTKDLRIDEPLVADGLESFVRNQFFPINLNILIGQQSQFVYYFNESHSRRKGRMTEKQKSMRELMYAGKSFLGSKISKMFKQLLEYAGKRNATPVVQLHTDKHPIYRRMIKAWNQSAEVPVRIEHFRTSSEEPRTTENALFAVNYFDRLIRKDMPNHRRETICYARNDRNLLSRFVYYLVTHNFHKPYRISSNAKQMEVTHAEHAMGKSEEQEEWKHRFHKCRFFKSFVEMPKYFEDVWFRRTPTPLKLGTDPVPAFAYQ